MNKTSRIKLNKKERLLIFSRFESDVESPSKFLKLSYSTYKKYKYGMLSTPVDVFHKISNVSKISTLHYGKILQSNWGAVKGGKIGIRSLYKKYGKERFSEWRRAAAYRNPFFRSKVKSIRYPKENEALGEFIGIVLGDGTLTKYFVRITGDKITDYFYFKEYVPKLIQKLFGIKPSISFDNSRIYVIVLSVRLCEYLNKKWELPYGDKILNKAHIPRRLFENSSMLKACIRGLIDTDGYIGKDGDSFCVRFTSHNPILFKEVNRAMNMYDLISFSYGKELGTRSKDRILRYMEKIGCSNLKNAIRFKEYNENNKFIKVKDLNFQKHLDTKLPYKWTRGLSVGKTSR